MSVDPSGEKKRHYMPSLDGLRGVACLLVVWSHLNALLHITKENYVLGSSGVILFFTLSGFLMGTLYFYKPATIDSTIKFLIARFSRITPAYYIAVTFALIASHFMLDQHYAMNFLMMVRSYLFAGSAGVFWSIPPEIQFYLFFLLIWGGYYRAKRGQYALMVLVILLSAIFMATREYWGGILLPSKYHIFLFGLAGAVLLAQPSVQRITGNIFFQLVILMSAIFYLKIFINHDNIYSDFGLPLLFAALVTSFSTSTAVTRILEIKWMRIVGNASFSIYLLHDILLHLYSQRLLNMHWPLAADVAIIIFVSLSLPIAFHFMVERYLHEGSRKIATNIYEKGKTRLFGPHKKPA